MKAVVWTQYGPPSVLQLREVAKPVTHADEILVKIAATTVSAGDCEVRALKLPFWLALPMRLYVGIRRPTRVTILGQELAGEVVEVGSDVAGWHPGDEIFAMLGFTQGSYAEYVALSTMDDDTLLAAKPVNLSFAEAAAVPLGGLEALRFLRKAAVQPGERVLINGAGGSIGTFAIQLAKHWGAEVTAVDSTDKVDMLRSLGADQAIDYTREDFTQRDEAYDVIFDVVGKSSFGRSVAMLSEDGRYLIANPRLSKILRALWVRATSSKRVRFAATGNGRQDLLDLKELLEAGAIRPIIDRCYPLDQIVAAHEYVETGQKQGALVIQVD